MQWIGEITNVHINMMQAHELAEVEQGRFYGVATATWEKKKKKKDLATLFVG